MSAGLLTDVQPRIDILMLGILAHEKIVGIYTLAAMIADGLNQLVLVIQINLNPTLAKLLSSNKWHVIKTMITKANLILIPMSAFFALIGYLCFPMLIKYIVNDPLFLQGQEFYLIIVVGIVISSGYIVFGLILNQAGKPSQHTLLLFSSVITNIFLTGIFIPLAGARGAAIASGLTFVMTVFYLKLIVKRTLNHTI